MVPFEDHELIFLGTGGGRVHTATQHRKTGGIIYSFNGKQAHIDPGPGAIVNLNQMKIDRLKTYWIIATHNHTDHINDVPIIIESAHKTLTTPAGILISTQNYLNELPAYYKNLLLDIIPMNTGKIHKLTPHTQLMGTKIIHGDISGFGLIFTQTNPSNPSQSYRIGFTSDTEIYPNFIDNYNDVDILVANILHPNDKIFPRHACVDELIPVLKKIKPKVCILTHFGALFDSPWSSSNVVASEMKNIQEQVGMTTKIIGAEDGMRIKLNKFSMD